MTINDIKLQEKELIKNIIISHISNNEKNFYYEVKDITTIIYKCIEKLTLTEKDYEEIATEATQELLIKNIFSKSNEAYKIKEKMSYVLKDYSFEYSIDNKDIYLYYHLKNNQSYLINYDNLENIWYLALIETTTLNLIEELYNGPYIEFMNFIDNLKSR